MEFRDTTIAVPNSKEVLRRYLGPSIDVGPAMTAKILKANGQVVHRSTYRSLTDQEWVDEIEKKARDEFDELGAPMKAFDFYNDVEDIEDMTKYDLYADDHGENHRHTSESYPTPEAGDEYEGMRRV